MSGKTSNVRYEIHPAIGIARVGNDPTPRKDWRTPSEPNIFYLDPPTIGGLPLECDVYGNPVDDGARAGSLPREVQEFKSKDGLVRRQAACFKVYKYNPANPDDPGVEVNLATDVKSFKWTVHIANKKAAWYEFTLLKGNLLLGEGNSYLGQRVDLRNKEREGRERQALIIDPGPRSLTQVETRETFFREDEERIKETYPHFSFPHYASEVPAQGYRIDVLGEMRTNAQGGLLVLGGYGRAGGDQPIGGFGGADSWYDDIADGPVTCELTLEGESEPLVLHAWVIVGSPKIAPELVNIVTLDDVLYDVGIRFGGLDPDLYDEARYAATGGWNPEYCADFSRDIEPIIKRPADYQWVANVQGMMPLTSPSFDPRAKDQPGSTQLYQKRQTYLSYFRPPELHAAFPHGATQLFKSQVAQAQVMLEEILPFLEAQPAERIPQALVKLRLAQRLDSVQFQLDTAPPQLKAIKKNLEALAEEQRPVEAIQKIDAALAALGTDNLEAASRKPSLSRTGGSAVREKVQGAQTQVQVARACLMQALAALEQTPADTQQARARVEQGQQALSAVQKYMASVRTDIQDAQHVLAQGSRQAAVPGLREVLTREQGTLGQVFSLFVQEQGVPLVPLQAGTNPVRNHDGPIDKFFTLTPTRYFLLKQWAEGNFTVDSKQATPRLHPQDQASTGNCVGWPMSPGIEVTWNMFHPHLYRQPYNLRYRTLEASERGQSMEIADTYRVCGLDPGRDETALTWWFLAAVRAAYVVAMDRREQAVAELLLQAMNAQTLQEVTPFLQKAGKASEQAQVRAAVEAAASICGKTDISRLLGYAYELAVVVESEAVALRLLEASQSAQLQPLAARIKEIKRSAQNTEVQDRLAAVLRLIEGAAVKEALGEALFEAVRQGESEQVRQALAQAYQCTILSRIISELAGIKAQSAEVKQAIQRAIGARDAAERNLGCEPGDLTKRMAMPWQADFFQCTVQFINFTDPTMNKDAAGIPLPPTYYAHWWPPQRPMQVLSGDVQKEVQQQVGTPAGFQVSYDRGIASYQQAIMAWPYLGFVINQNRSLDERRDYPYFVEIERDHGRFTVASIAVRNAQGFVTGGEDGENFLPVYYLNTDAETLLDHQLTMRRVPTRRPGEGGQFLREVAREAAVDLPYGTDPAAAPVTRQRQGSGLHEYRS
ncbi:MAG TPA: LodA/GoxA family CTQ-dependent oxidase [Ktedonobacteraceae bacterium]|jgi:hypothetical protein